MGCCHSTPENQQNSPYSGSNAQDESSSQAITSSARNPETSRVHSSSQQQRSRRRIGLGEQFNAPLRPHPWTAERRWTRKELSREREEFFDTRVTNSPEIWAALNSVVGLLRADDIPTAQSILDAAGVTVPTGDLVNGAWDSNGNNYQIPAHIINDPDNVVIDAQDEFTKDECGGMVTDDDEVERRREEKGKAVIKSEDTIKVKARLSDRGGPDVAIAIGKDQNVRVLIRRIQEEASIPGHARVKIAYSGRVLDEGKTLPAQGWREGHVVNAYISGID